MKTDKTPRLGILDALTMGLNIAIRRPWLIVIPAAMDLALWLSPRLAVNNLTQRFLAIWEAFFRVSFAANQAGASEMVAAVRDGMTQMGRGVNLAEAVTGGWLFMPSAVASFQTSRLMLISNDILAPIGISLPLGNLSPPPRQPATIEVNSIWGALLIVVGLWLVGQLIVAFFLRWAARDPGVQTNTLDQPGGGEAGAAFPTQRWAGSSGLLTLTARLTGFSVLLALAVLVLYMPLGVTMILVTVTSSAAMGLLFAVTGGMTLWLLMWLLTAVFFVSESIVLEGQSLGQGLRHNFGRMRGSALRTTGLIVVVNVILLGFRAVWGLVGQTPVGAVASIIGNAYLATAMLLAVYVYYGELRQRGHAGAVKDQGKMTNKG
jgi:hypothetical protein